MKPSASNSNDKDRRVRRTRNALIDALLELIAERGYDRTTVQDILDRANVGRSTFYTHFYNKEDLFLERMTIFNLNVPEDGNNDGQSPRMPDVTGLFEHVAQMHAFLKSMHGSDTLAAAEAVAREDLTRSFRKLFRNRDTNEAAHPQAPSFSPGSLPAR